MKIHTNGAMRQSHARGDFRTGHPFHEAKDERLAISVLQRTENRQDYSCFLLDNMVIGPGLRMIFSGRFRGAFRRNGLSKVIVGTVAGDGSQPGSESRHIPQGMQLPKRQKKNLLNQVINFARRHATEKDAMEHAKIAVVEKAE